MSFAKTILALSTPWNEIDNRNILREPFSYFLAHLLIVTLTHEFSGHEFNVCTQLL